MAQNPQLDQEQVARVAARQLGSQEPQPQANQDSKQTTEEKVQEQASPQTEGDQVQETPYAFEVDFGGEKRKLTPEQIKGTYERYASLNHKHSQYKPVMDLAERLTERIGGNPEDTASVLMSALKQASQKNAQYGKNDQSSPGDQADGTERGQPTNEDFSKMMEKWEEENAVTLPPGYKDAASRMAQIEGALQQQQQMMQQLLQMGQGVAGAAKESVQGAQGQQADAVKQTIRNNLASAGERAGLTDSETQDFMTFAGERGYSLEDFVDGNMATKVVTDFVNARNSGEFGRLQEIAKRRQAFTGSVGATPAAQGEAPAKAPGEQQLDRMVERAFANRIS